MSFSLQLPGKGRACKATTDMDDFSFPDIAARIVLNGVTKVAMMPRYRLMRPGPGHVAVVIAAPGTTAAVSVQ